MENRSTIAQTAASQPIAIIAIMFASPGAASGPDGRRSFAFALLDRRAIKLKAGPTAYWLFGAGFFAAGFLATGFFSGPSPISSKPT